MHRWPRSRFRTTFIGTLTLNLILCVLPWSATVAQTPITPASQSKQLIQAAPVTALPAKGKRYALIIGVDKYRDGQITTLSGGVNDAHHLADALVNYAGFPADQVIVLATDQPEERQPTRINILTNLSYMASYVPKDGLLLVSFSGHGIERDGRAFLIPADARLSENIILLEESAVSVARMHDWIKATGVGQVVVLLDACRNDPGGRADAPNPLSAAYTKGFSFDVRNREVQAYATLYATQVGYRAWEYTEKKQGYFTWAVVQGLQGGAANAKGEVTLAALVTYVQENVPKRILMDLGPGKQQKPFADIAGYGANDLVLAVAAPTAIAPASPSTSPGFDPASIELSFWESIKSSTDPADFRAYLDKYGETGRFSPLAHNRIRQMEGAGKPDNAKGQPPANTTGGVSEGNASSTVSAAGTSTRSQYGIDFVWIAPGTFMMGSPKGEAGRSDDEKQHQVTISKGFYLGKYEVTQGQWMAVMGNRPSHFQGCDQCPVETVSYSEVKGFIMRMNALNDGFSYRLPTEAEWEYAARAGTTGPYAGDLDEMAWYDANSVQKTHPVGQLRPNAWGLFDMHGNVYEWVQDWFGPYEAGAQTDPTGPSSGKYRGRRGGDWAYDARHARSAYRHFFEPGNRDSDLGFRLVRTPM